MVRRVLVVLCIAALAEESLFGADARKRIWTMDLATIVHHSGDEGRGEYVWGLAFSPDETKLAIGFGQHWDPTKKQPRGSSRGHVVIAPLEKPKDSRVLEVGESHWAGWSIGWAPSGSWLIVHERPPILLRPDGQKGCSLPEERTFAGFLSGDRMVFLDDQRIGGDKSIELLGPDCVPVGTGPGPFREVATCPRLDLVLSEHLDGESASVKVRDTNQWSAKQSWEWPNSSILPGLRFADSCRAVCTGTEGKSKGTSLACWDIGTGQKVNGNPSVVLDIASIASTGGELVAMTDHKIIDHEGKIWVYLDMDGTYLRPKRQVVWNLRTGKEVASWHAQIQKFEINPGEIREQQFLLALSPSGKYLAEGGSGSVTLYRLKE
jgi:WD40 repeat protein